MTAEQPTHIEEPVPAEEVEPAGDGLQARLDAAEAERDDFFDRLQRVTADFENYRKRAARDQAAFGERATERLVSELLPVLDALEGALEAAGHEEAKLEEGVRLVHRQLADALGKQGVAEIDTDGKFDPHVHEAVLSQPSEAEEGSIVDVLQKGYRLGEKVVRPARVAVSAGAPQVPEV
ncbi:MAG: molecular chaperone GrpE [Gaiellaceae bacterium]|nr:molecular chaperone GrpE [Gaiellaceae bacterium]